MALIIFAFVHSRRRKQFEKQIQNFHKSDSAASIKALDLLKPLEVNRECVSILNELGDGQFGKVYEGSAVGLPNNKSIVTVAVKFLHDESSESQEAFLSEASRMLKLTHPRFVQLLAVCFESAPNFIVLEHMSNGDLKHFLMEHKEAYMSGSAETCISVMHRMSCELSAAMVYLESINYVHRDLAARNVLVDSSESLKLGDFGECKAIVAFM